MTPRHRIVGQVPMFTTGTFEVYVDGRNVILYDRAEGSHDCVLVEFGDMDALIKALQEVRDVWG